jgi:hypothetical protein
MVRGGEVVQPFACQFLGERAATDAEGIFSSGDGGGLLAGRRLADSQNVSPLDGNLH